jgi:hypothetical protein
MAATLRLNRISQSHAGRTLHRAEKHPLHKGSDRSRITALTRDAGTASLLSRLTQHRAEGRRSCTLPPGTPPSQGHARRCARSGDALASTNPSAHWLVAQSSALQSRRLPHSALWQSTASCFRQEPGNPGAHQCTSSFGAMGCSGFMSCVRLAGHGQARSSSTLGAPSSSATQLKMARASGHQGYACERSRHWSTWAL